MDSQTQYTRSTQPPGTNGTNSMDVWVSQPTSKVSGILSLSSRVLLSACVQNLWWPAGYQPRNGLWSSTLVLLEKYSQPLGPATLDTTSWEISTFACANCSQLTGSRTLRLPNSSQSLYISSNTSKLPIEGVRNATGHQKPGLDLFILSPQSRRVLTGRHQHPPPPLPPPRSPVLYWSAVIQYGQCKPIHTSSSQFVQPLFHHTKKTISMNIPLTTSERPNPKAVQ